MRGDVGRLDKAGKYKVRSPAAPGLLNVVNTSASSAQSHWLSTIEIYHTTSTQPFSLFLVPSFVLAASKTKEKSSAICMGNKSGECSV